MCAVVTFSGEDAVIQDQLDNNTGAGRASICRTRSDSEVGAPGIADQLDTVVNGDNDVFGPSKAVVSDVTVVDQYHLTNCRAVRAASICKQRSKSLLDEGQHNSVSVQLGVDINTIDDNPLGIDGNNFRTSYDEDRDALASTCQVKRRRRPRPKSESDASKCTIKDQLIFTVSVQSSDVVHQSIDLPQPGSLSSLDLWTSAFGIYHIRTSVMVTDHGPPVQDF